MDPFVLGMCGCVNMCVNTNPEKWRVALPIVTHCKVVRLWPQDLHNVLIELGLFFLQTATKREAEDVFMRERGDVSHSSFISSRQ